MPLPLGYSAIGGGRRTRTCTGYRDLCELQLQHELALLEQCNRAGLV